MLRQFIQSTDLPWFLCGNCGNNGNLASNQSQSLIIT